MMLHAAEVQLRRIEEAVAATSYGFERRKTGDTGAGATTAHQDPGFRRALWIVAVLNVGYGAVEMAGGFLAVWQAPKADALDVVDDGLVTFPGILAIGWNLARVLVRP